VARQNVVARLGDPDREAHRLGYLSVCGLDEVGRGPLAGPVVAAAAVLPPGAEIPGLGDSKALTPGRRAGLVPEIRRVCRAWAVAEVPPGEIDRLNILQASLLAMSRALGRLGLTPDFLLVDGVHRVPSEIPQQTLIRGDARSTAVAAASVLAKEHRDALMTEYARLHPGYGFEVHKGYPTAAHREALGRLGPCPIHRRTFRGVREFLEGRVQGQLFPFPRR